MNEPKPPAAFRRLFEPLTIGSLTLRNRIVNTMHGSGLGEARDLRYLQARARGGAACSVYTRAVGSTATRSARVHALRRSTGMRKEFHRSRPKASRTTTTP